MHCGFCFVSLCVFSPEEDIRHMLVDGEPFIFTFLEAKYLPKAGLLPTPLPDTGCTQQTSGTYSRTEIPSPLGTTATATLSFVCNGSISLTELDRHVGLAS